VQLAHLPPDVINNKSMQNRRWLARQVTATGRKNSG
jgi:hypothetical protein